jgi:hypothetical protein
MRDRFQPLLKSFIAHQARFANIPGLQPLNMALRPLRGEKRRLKSPTSKFAFLRLLHGRSTVKRPTAVRRGIEEAARSIRNIGPAYDADAQSGFFRLEEALKFGDVIIIRKVRTAQLWNQPSTNCAVFTKSGYRPIWLLGV